MTHFGAKMTVFCRFSPKSGRNEANFGDTPGEKRLAAVLRRSTDFWIRNSEKNVLRGVV